MIGTTTAAHWAERYIGMPWTPQSNCWHFCARVWSEVFGIAVPLVDIDGADARAARRAFASSAEDAALRAMSSARFSSCQPHER